MGIGKNKTLLVSMGLLGFVVITGFANLAQAHDWRDRHDIGRGRASVWKSRAQVPPGFYKRNLAYRNHMAHPGHGWGKRPYRDAYKRRGLFW